MFHLWIILILISIFYTSQKEIDWRCYFVGKENLFLFVKNSGEKKYAFCTDIWIAVTLEVSTHCTIALNSIPQEGIQSRYHLEISEMLSALIVKWHKYLLCLNYLISFSLGYIYWHLWYLINNQALNLYFHHFSS